MKRVALIFGMVFILFMQHHHTHVRRSFGEFDQWFACEQKRMEIERTTDWRGECISRPVLGVT